MDIGEVMFKAGLNHKVREDVRGSLFNGGIVITYEVIKFISK